MDIIPVMDLLGGLVVQAVRGERETYGPVDSVLVDNASPVAVASALAAETNCRAMYIADLDAIQGGLGHGDILKELCREMEPELWVDAGVTEETDAERILALGVDRVIIGTETIKSLQDMRAVLGAVPPEKIMPSLDVRGGKVLSKASELENAEPLEALKKLRDLGLDRFILLTLDVVGSGGGPDWALLKAARERFPQLGVIAGGGVKGMADLQEAESLGLDGVLVATALHKGWIRGRDLSKS